MPLLIAECEPLIRDEFKKPALQPTSAPPGKIYFGRLYKLPAVKLLAPYPTLLQTNLTFPVPN